MLIMRSTRRIEPMAIRMTAIFRDIFRGDSSGVESSSEVAGLAAETYKVAIKTQSRGKQM